MRQTRWTRKKARFLDAYRACGMVSEAARRVKVGRSTVYEWRKEDPAFAAAWDDIDAALADELEAEAIRRAKAGSDTLLIFLLKGLKPERYRERVQADLQHHGHVDVTHHVDADEFNAVLAALGYDPLGTVVAAGSATVGGGNSATETDPGGRE